MGTWETDDVAHGELTHVAHERLTHVTHGKLTHGGMGNMAGLFIAQGGRKGRMRS